jgi:hypothetical protein
MCIKCYLVNRHLGCPIHWTGLLDWTTGMDHWNGLPNWTTGMDYRTGLDWTTGLDYRTGPLDWTTRMDTGLDYRTGPLEWTTGMDPPLSKPLGCCQKNFGSKVIPASIVHASIPVVHSSIGMQEGGGTTEQSSQPYGFIRNLY